MLPGAEGSAAWPAKSSQIAPSPTAATLGGVTITGNVHYASHAHGGDPATLHSARFTLEARGPAAQAVRLEALELLSAHCLADGWRAARPLPLRRLELDEEKVPQAGLVIRPGKRRQLRIDFADTPVYQGCNRFGFRARFTTGEHSAWVEAPLKVVRKEPARPPF